MKKCKNCPRVIKDKYTLCFDCSKNDPYKGWRGVYESERRKKVR